MTTLERLDALIGRGVFYDCDWETLKAVREGSGELLEALEAIIARWDTPAWKDVEPTAEVINRARSAISKAKGEA